MRLISQNGAIDIPYERFIISVNMQNQGEIIAWTGNNISDDECIVMAIYSSREKAQKAMEMLRTAYTGTPLIFENCDVTDEVFAELKRRSIEAILTVTNDKPKVDYLDNFYFQFPKDEDVEV